MKKVILQSNNDFDENIAAIIIQYSEVILNTKSLLFRYTSPYLMTETGYFKAMNQPIGAPNITRQVPSPSSGFYLWNMDNVNKNHIQRELQVNECDINICFHFVDYFNSNGRDVFIVILPTLSPSSNIFVVLNGKIKMENKTFIINKWCRTLTQWSADINMPQTKEDHFTALDLLRGHILCVIRSDFASSVKINCELEIHCIDLNQNKDVLYHPHSWTNVINAK